MIPHQPVANKQKVRNNFKKLRCTSSQLFLYSRKKRMLHIESTQNFYKKQPVIKWMTKTPQSYALYKSVLETELMEESPSSQSEVSPCCHLTHSNSCFIWYDCSYTIQLVERRKHLTWDFWGYQTFQSILLSSQALSLNTRSLKKEQNKVLL